MTTANIRTRQQYDWMNWGGIYVEDVVGGHIWIGAMCIAGGIWHIITEPFSWIEDKFIFNGHGILMSGTP